MSWKTENVFGNPSVLIPDQTSHTETKYAEQYQKTFLKLELPYYNKMFSYITF